MEHMHHGAASMHAGILPGDWVTRKPKGLLDNANFLALCQSLRPNKPVEQLDQKVAFETALLVLGRPPMVMANAIAVTMNANGVGVSQETLKQDVARLIQRSADNRASGTLGIFETATAFLVHAQVVHDIYAHYLEGGK
jgi:hypothetical protein